MDLFGSSNNGNTGTGPPSTTFSGTTSSGTTSEGKCECASYQDCGVYTLLAMNCHLKIPNRRLD